ncbi:TetR/AcrR family transcriptional regulator [Streptomyces sp. FIT100]|uniref:TetR/AcrR family transcriptional regulator n=1 Tax=Streptomyces sp. FIT100 TaxID=2837956 RepID=UPI0021C8940D|nr:TetR family transcriptional regulator [Streptomyces sp. FIT100]UUN30918.1 TetR family transcriptional regulator C-terminal domain-containing protein [Streptomyces sp. FIT100]
MTTHTAAAADDGAYAADTPQRRILAAAAAVLIERGFPDTRVADVAKHAGVSAGLVMYYFTSRDQLLTKARRFAEDVFYDDARRRLDALGHPGRRLAELIHLAFAPENGLPVPSSWLLWFDLWQQAIRHPQLRAEREELDRRWRDTIADIVREGQAAGYFRPVDADEFAVMLSAMSDGLAVGLTLKDTGIGHERATALCMRLCAHELGAGWLGEA